MDRTWDGDEVEAPDDAPDVADEKQDGRDELEDGDPDVDEQQTGAVDVVTLRTRAARQTHTRNKRPCSRHNGVNEHSISASQSVAHNI